MYADFESSILVLTGEDISFSTRKRLEEQVQQRLGRLHDGLLSHGRRQTQPQPVHIIRGKYGGVDLHRYRFYSLESRQENSLHHGIRCLDYSMSRCVRFMCTITNGDFLAMQASYAPNLRPPFHSARWRRADRTKARQWCQPTRFRRLSGSR